MTKVIAVALRGPAGIDRLEVGQGADRLAKIKYFRPRFFNLIGWRLLLNVANVDVRQENTAGEKIAVVEGNLELGLGAIGQETPVKIIYNFDTPSSMMPENVATLETLIAELPRKTKNQGKVMAWLDVSRFGDVVTREIVVCFGFCDIGVTEAKIDNFDFIAAVPIPGFSVDEFRIVK